MVSITTQRDLVINFKRETLLNLGILSKLQPMPFELSKQIFKENALEKPTQNVFNHLAHFLVSIIDPAACTALPWPLYDTQAERKYRNELSALIADYSSKGLVSPVMSSYLVNPGCYKVTFLMFQLSQLAVQRVLSSKMNKEHQKRLYTDMTEQYKAQKNKFIDGIEKETEIMLSKFSNYLKKREVTEKAAEMLRNKIRQMEEALEQSKAQQCINNLIDGYLKQHPLPEEKKTEFIKLKNVNDKTQIFNNWLNYFDTQINVIESEWDTKMTPFISLCQKTLKNSETLIARQTGEADKKTFAIEYNPKTDEICMKELQSLVNSQQKYILKNLVKEDKLSFPNLIRGFLISVCFILKNNQTDPSIDMFNECLEGGRRSYSEVVQAMKVLVGRVMGAEATLSPPADKINMSVSLRELTVIPPIPDLSDLKMNEQYHPPITYDAFTPLNFTKHQFNLHTKANINNSFTRPYPKSLITPFHHKNNRDNFLRSISSNPIIVVDQRNVSMNITNISTISHGSKVNETVAECPGFTQQQIFRLLSTKKSTSSKKFKHKTVRPNIHVIKGGLFNESTSSNETFGLYRSQSSPNLFNIREKLSNVKSRARKLSIMKEASPTTFEVSGIGVLDRDSNQSTPKEQQGLEHSLEFTKKFDKSTPKEQENISLQITKELVRKSPVPVTVKQNTDSLTSLSVISDISSTDKLDLNKEINITAEGTHDITLVTEFQSLEFIQTSQYEPQSLGSILTKKKDINNKLHTPRSMDSIPIMAKDKPMINKRQVTKDVEKTHKNFNHLQQLHKISHIPLRTTENHNIPSRIDITNKNTNMDIPLANDKYTKNIQNHTENVQKARKITENFQLDWKCTEDFSTKPGSTKDIHKEYQSIENIQKDCKSTVNIHKECHSTENIQKENLSTENIQPPEHKSLENTQTQSKSKDETPQSKHLLKKTSSIEKIIKRFKKVRASILPNINFNTNEDETDFQIIAEEKENLKTLNAVNIDMFTANRVLLPDLLSPSCSILTQKTENYQELLSFDDEDTEVKRRPRESLGATLGVDHTFLDEFDLID